MKPIALALLVASALVTVGAAADDTLSAPVAIATTTLETALADGTEPLADETPADETPADETPADETPADETPAETATTEGTPITSAKLDDDDWSELLFGLDDDDLLGWVFFLLSLTAFSSGTNGDSVGVPAQH